MKKSQLRNIIRESIKELMTEQSPGSIPTTFIAALVPCGTPLTLTNQGILSGGQSFGGCTDLGTTSPSVGDVFTLTGGWYPSYINAVGDNYILTSFGSTLSTPQQCYNHQGPNFIYYSTTAIPNSGGCPPLCDTTPASACATQWWQNPNATWAANWINNRDCSNYTWPALNLEQQALDIMNDTNNYGTNTPNPQTGPFNGFQDIWDAGNNSGLINPHKNQFVGKMAKSKYSQCQKQACNC